MTLFSELVLGTTNGYGDSNKLATIYYGILCEANRFKIIFMNAKNKFIIDEYLKATFLSK